MKIDFKNLDEITKEIQSSKLSIIAGRPQIGKTSLVLGIVKNVVENEDMSVGIFSLAESKEYILNTVSNNTKIIVYGTPNISIKKIQEKCRNLKREENIGMVVIDYLQLINKEEKNISEIGCLLKKLAEELEVCIIIVSQLSKKTDKRYEEERDPRPILEDFGQSSELVKYADTVALLYRNDYYNKNREKENILEVNFVKNKYNKEIKIKLNAHISID